MQKLIYQAVKKSRSFAEIEKNLIAFLKNISDKNTQIGFVTGIINSDGPECVERHKNNLQKATKLLQQQNEFPIFSCLDVYENELREMLIRQSVTYQDYLLFWRHILESGYITILYLTPGWQRSTGVKDEIMTAKKMGLKIIEV